MTGPDGVRSLAVLHRPMWDLDEIKAGQGVRTPANVPDARQSIWISFVPLADVERDLAALTFWRNHRFLAGPEYPFEALKIGGGPAPLRVPEGWLLLHHGVTGTITSAFDQQQNVNYAVGAMILDADDPTRVIARSPEPLLAAGDRGGAQRHRAERRLPHRDRRDRRRALACSTAWPTRRSASPDSIAVPPARHLTEEYLP